MCEQKMYNLRLFTGLSTVSTATINNENVNQKKRNGSHKYAQCNVLEISPKHNCNICETNMKQ